VHEDKLENWRFVSGVSVYRPPSFANATQQTKVAKVDE
jgi:hypothetical protein